jgi:hypothetical protein
VQEICPLRSTWRGLESTGGGQCCGSALPRTAPVLDPTYSAGNQSPPGPLLVEGNLSMPIRTETFRSLCRSKPLRKDAARNSVKLRILAGIASGSRPEVAAGSPACNTSFWGGILLVV